MLYKQIKINEFKEVDLDKIKEIIDITIDKCYVNIYSPEAINYFKQCHSKENILSDAKRGTTLTLIDNLEIIGTGTLLGEEIKRVFVLRQYQGQGLGKLIMTHLEEHAVKERLKKVTLCSLLVSKKFYEKLRYTQIKENFIDLGNGEKLDHYEMFKELREDNLSGEK